MRLSLDKAHRTVCCLVAVALVTIDTFGQDAGYKEGPSRPAVSVERIESGIRVDGKLDDAAWKKAAVFDHFTQREPNEGAPASERTELRILYSESNLYISVRCWDSRVRQIVANEMRRDISLLNNDCVEIFLDTYHDHRTAFLFSTNPLGAQRDGIVTADVSDEEQNWDWNGVWENESSIDSTGWTAEIAIPFRTLRFLEGDEQTWGINIARLVPRKREEAFLFPILRDYGWYGKYRVASYGHLTGLTNLQHPGKLELKPFALPALQRDFAKEQTYRRTVGIGLDAKYRLTPNLTADISLNTDFAQVEADQEQINLTRFELFFPEKRDFFLEGASIFRFGERSFSPVIPASVLFFSRRIGLSQDNEPIPLLGGVKMTGKIGSTNVGLINMLANRASYINEDNEYVSIPRTNFSVLRLRQDILTNSSVGLIGLNKQSVDDRNFNRAAGFDANIYLTPNLQVAGFLAKTHSRDSAGNDMAAYGDLTYNDDFYTLMVSQNSIQDNFNPEMGFVPRTGIRKTQVHLGVAPRPKVLGIRQLFVFNDFYYISNQSGGLETRLNYSGLFSVFEDGATFLALFGQNYERLTEEFEVHEGNFIPLGVYRFSQLYSEFQSDLSRPISGKATLNVGGFYNGKITGYGLGANVKFGSRFTANLTLNQNWIKLPSGDFTTSVVGVRVLYTFSPKLFAKAFVQWNSEGNAIIGNFLINFIHTPGSDLFLVYNEELDTSGRRFKPAARALMLKVTYLILP